MKIIMLHPHADTLFTKKQLEKLRASGKLNILTQPKPVNQIPELQTQEEKIIVIDPDFCDWQVPDELITNTPNLKAICLSSTSYSWINTELATQNKISVVNQRGFSTQAVAEYAITMAFILARKIPLIMQSNWQLDYTTHLGTELADKTVGVIGLGSIGSQIAHTYEGLGMNVQYWSKKSRNPDYKYASLNQLMKSSDIIFPTLASNTDTNNLITDNHIDSMKSSAFFVSIVHHELYNHEKLVDLSSKEKIGGYSFEVEEPSKPTKYLGNTWASPALGWVTDGSHSRNAVMTIESVIQATKGNFPNRIN